MFIDPPGCGCGFMSEERMRLLLNIDQVGSPVNVGRRQQITPDMRFTCDGMITKWIIGATWQGDDNLYPELQVWRNIGNSTYQKINGTFVMPTTSSPDRIYEYDGFPPIPVRSGDILGIFLPRTSRSRLRLTVENIDRPTNYYLTTDDSASESPYDVIDVQNMPLIMSEDYQPMVTVEIGESSHFKLFCM